MDAVASTPSVAAPVPGPGQLIRRSTLSLVLACALFASVPFAGAAESGEDEHPLLRQARQNVEEVAAELEAAKRSRNLAESALARVDERLAAVEADVNAAVDAVRLQEVEVQLAAVRLQALQDEADALTADLADLARELFVNGSGSELEVVLTSGDIQAAIERTAFLNVISETDRAALEDAIAARRRLAAEAERFDQEIARLERMRDEQQALLDSVQTLREERAAALLAADQEVDDLNALQDDLSGDYERIEELIENAAATPVAASPPSAEGYGWPLCRRITSRFGYRWGRQHRGIDIDGDTGDAIAASKAGVVIAAGREGGYGNLTLIDHGDGIVTAYAHQSEIIVFVGQSVERGERIGSVGNTGNSTGPHLHFETRVNGTAVDPLQYLPDSC